MIIAATRVKHNRLQQTQNTTETAAIGSISGSQRTSSLPRHSVAHSGKQSLRRRRHCSERILLLAASAQHSSHRQKKTTDGSAFDDTDEVHICAAKMQQQSGTCSARVSGASWCSWPAAMASSRRQPRIKSSPMNETAADEMVIMLLRQVAPACAAPHCTHA